MLSCVEVQGRDKYEAPGRLAPGRGAEHALWVENVVSLDFRSPESFVF